MADGNTPAYDITVTSPARVWDYWLGGKDNYAVDRETAGNAAAAMPSMPRIARASRRFLTSAVTLLTQEHGVRQFLDIGSGLPTADNTHEVAQRLAPDARVVYVDHDPVVLRHGQALLASAPEGATDFVQADLRDAEKVLAEAGRTLDFRRPVAVFLITVLHFIPDSDRPHEIVSRLTRALAPGSFLAVLHAPSDVRADEVSGMARNYNSNTPSPITPRPRAEVARFFDGLEMVPPGLVNFTGWPGLGDTDPGLAGYVGIGRKP